MGNLQDDVEGDVGAVPRCQCCGSERVARDAWACWNPESGLWELENVFDDAHCHKCEGETKLVWARQEIPPNQRIRELNDRFRRGGLGNGSVMLTSGIQERGGVFVAAAVKAVRSFDNFSNQNDPWGEHDFGAVEVEDEKVFWKIDYFSPDLTAGSENPANEGVTHRVLTIMLSSEY
ncbi:DUF3768 domain-containing protein [Roseovarius aestuarii]|uniref:DUF3768 domain-containing protein n=1 Tax=Roseovarius aestuarii TaxID=475083 RepID=A0A1X7BQE9_9RHOB|nr:DUF3768 domain-containing protein [Roseovarius aestuarii]SMC11815.1 hypothetical protein ROA7745_01634 [Roseovarius aestuarii]